jgi:hypothetical protein
MQEFIPIRIECHSGYKADEYPVRFYWDDVLFEISKILDRWYQGDSDPEFTESDYFKVKTVSSGQFILKHDMKNDLWFLVISGR